LYLTGELLFDVGFHYLRFAQDHSVGRRVSQALALAAHVARGSLPPSEPPAGKPMARRRLGSTTCAGRKAGWGPSLVDRL
jgi:hypothetical protein